MYTKWWCLSSWWGHHIEIRLKLQAPNYSARNLWRCQIVFLFPPKISQGNYDHVKLFSSFPYFQQLWRDHWCRFSQVLFVRGWTLCYTGKEEPALCVLAYRVKLKHYSYTVVLSSIYTTLPSLKAFWWQKHRAANHFNSPRVPPKSGTFHPNLIWHMIAGRGSRSGGWKQEVASYLNRKRNPASVCRDIVCASRTQSVCTVLFKHGAANVQSSSTLQSPSVPSPG